MLLNCVISKDETFKLPIAFPVVLTHFEVESDIVLYIEASGLALIFIAGLGVFHLLFI